MSERRQYVATVFFTADDLQHAIDIVDEWPVDIFSVGVAHDFDSNEICKKCGEHCREPVPSQRWWVGWPCRVASHAERMKLP